MEDVSYKSLLDNKYHAMLWGYNSQSHNSCPPGAHSLKEETGSYNTVQGRKHKHESIEKGHPSQPGQGAKRHKRVEVGGCQGAS